MMKQKYPKYPRHSFAAMLLGMVLALGAAVTAQAADSKDLVLKGDAKCTSCHDQDEKSVMAIGKTRHGATGDSRTPTCTSCHGASDVHTNHKGGNRPLPDRTFTKKTTTPAEVRNDACLSCHKGGNRMQWAGSQHEGQGLACTTCHTVHNQHDKVRDKATQTETCFSCHKEQRAQSYRQSHHPIQEGKVVCSNCHNPHGSSGPKLLHKNTVGETCFTCHAEKRGPFLWEHPPVSDNCTNCHTPHGSNNTALLKNRPPYLCASCHIAGGHSTTGIRSGTDLGVAGGGTNSAPQMVGKACLNCHTQIHGSNHPSGARFAR